MHIWLLGALPPDPHQGSAPGPHWGLPSPKSPVLTLPPNYGYATVKETTMECYEHDRWFFHGSQNLQISTNHSHNSLQ